MKKNLVIFYPCRKKTDMRVERMEKAAQKHDISYTKICTHELLFTEEGISHNGEKITFDKNTIYWMIGFPYVAKQISFLLKLEGQHLFPLIHDVVYDLDDKFFAHCFFTKQEIPTLKTALIEPYTLERSLEELGNFPLIIKTTLGSAGKGVEIVNDKEAIANFIKRQQNPSETSYMKKLAFILQEYIEENNGEDYRVLCIGQKVLGIIKRTAQDGFKSNVSLGGGAEHIESYPEMEAMALKIMKNSGLFMGGIDFIETKQGLKAIEINASPQYAGFEKATGIDVASHIIEELINR